MKRLLLSLLIPYSVFAQEALFNVNLSKINPEHYNHNAPSVEDLLADEKMNPELKKVILKGRDLFMNTQQLRGKNVFNDMNCRSCHMGEGAMNFSGPVWSTVTTLPDFRGKNKHVNDLQERIAGCFSYSMNGIPPEYGSDTMLALSAYNQWLAKGAAMYETRKIAGRGFNGIEKPEQEPSYEREEQVYKKYCAMCHSEDGQGQKNQDIVFFPPVWGENSYN